MKLEIQLPDKIYQKDTYVVNTEEKKGVKAGLEKSWRPWLKKNCRGLNIPISCEFCTHVGEAMYHCHNSESTHNHLNVQRFTTCSHWEPNEGLLMMLRRTQWTDLFSKDKDD